MESKKDLIVLVLCLGHCYNERKCSEPLGGGQMIKEAKIVNGVMMVHIAVVGALIVVMN